MAKGDDKTIISSAWSAAASIQKLAAPSAPSLSYDGGSVYVNWNKIDGNDGYQLSMNSSTGTVLLDIAKDVQSGSMKISPQADAGPYSFQVLTKAAGNTAIPSNWSVVFTIEKLAAPTLSPLSFADNKVTANWNNIAGNDGYQLTASFNPATGPANNVTQDVGKDVVTAALDVPGPSFKSCSVQVLTKGPRNTAIPSYWCTAQTINIDVLTPESLARQLKGEGKTAAQAAPLIKAQFSTIDLPTLANVLFTVFQPPTLSQSDLAAALVTAFPIPPLDATALASALVTVYPLTKPVTADALTATAQALKTVGFTMDQAAAGLAAAYDRPDVVLLTKVLKLVFLGPDLTPESLAKQLKADGKTAAQAAPLIKTQFPDVDLPTLAKVLFDVFPNLSQGDLAVALVAAFPVPPLDAPTIAQTLVTIYPFTKPASAEPMTDTAQALKAVGFNMNQTAAALTVAYSNPNAIVLAMVLKQVFIGPDLLHFDGISTAVILSKTNYTQIGYRDSGHANQLVNLANDGFTIDVSIYPEALDDRPIVTLVYENSGAAWKAGDLTVALSIFNGHIRVSALTPDWNAGVPSDPRLVTLTSEASVPLKQWSNISAAWTYGGMVRVLVNGQTQNLDVQNNHENWNQYNANSFVANGMRAVVGTFIPDNHRFIFGKYQDRSFMGYLKNIRIWRGPRVPDDIKQDPYKRLTDSEIAAAQTTVRGEQWAPVYLGGYWPLDEGSGNVARDRTQVQNDGNITNPEWSTPDT
jgi:hypothetical protein